MTTHHHLPQVPTAMALLAATKKFALELGPRIKLLPTCCCHGCRVAVRTGVTNEVFQEDSQLGRRLTHPHHHCSTP